jgi:hypothetical protein
MESGAGQQILKQGVRDPVDEYDGGQHAMDNPPTWAVWIGVAALGLAPGLAILLAPRIARLLLRLLSPCREVAPKPKRDRPTGVAATPG